VQWDQFAAECPEIARRARSRFAADELVLIGTLRRDGSPRISPNEVDFAAGRLMFGMMWRSRKALDLARDPRAVLHSVPSDRTNLGGDVKLHGRAIAEADPDVRAAYEDAIHTRIDWRPEGAYHLFSLDIAEASFVVFGEERFALAWNMEQGLRRSEVPG
jgi:hypothetical protein